MSRHREDAARPPPCADHGRPVDILPSGGSLPYERPSCPTRRNRPRCYCSLSSQPSLHYAEHCKDADVPCLPASNKSCCRQRGMHLSGDPAPARVKTRDRFIRWQQNKTESTFALTFYFESGQTVGNQNREAAMAEVGVTAATRCERPPPRHLLPRDMIWIPGGT